MKITSEQLKATKTSIAHWNRIAHRRARRGETIFGYHCKLCDVFRRRYDRVGNECNGCPVRIATSEPLCNGGPWGEVYHHFNDAKSINHQSAEFYVSARTMWQFLRDLLPIKQRRKVSAK